MASAVNELSLTPEESKSFVQQFLLLQKGHNELVVAYNNNIATYQQVLQHLDARIGMLMMAMDDQVRGELKIVENDEGKKTVNWRVYFEEYKAIVQADEIKRKKAEQANGNGEDPLVTPEPPPPAEETVVEFGGT